MPELPEVQTIVDDLKGKIRGVRIIGIKTTTKSIWRYKYPRKANIVGATASDVVRRGKYILIYLSKNNVLIVHLGMTGKLIFTESGSKPEKHTHVMLKFTNFDIHYNDIRRFGFMDLVSIDDLEKITYLTKLGPDPFEIERRDFISIIRSKKRMMKQLLLDQNVISGLGNIYSDEILFKARIHPRATSSKISEKRLGNLHAAALDILRNAIKARGSSISNYVDGSGSRGEYQNSHLVYGREGRPCKKCGAKIRREVIGSRSAHFCPRCQR
ncbi:MAG: bifunctional DNA-formamidopyrimidine glycosylase/DNA-(apurinic or apyrimidinic site) lyase [Candidatus Zixiibacteriota bacterium]|nr:MAG: bifunctional DNA-formamidopyrimidine glycosylase/DNA-(apurinic or apyrimidinic site) lyase [candidate division Zixibacteria bacterium]